MKKLDQLFIWDYSTLEGQIEEIHKKVVPLIDLVNSQQEAIEKLEKLVGIGQDINPVLVVENKPADDKPESKNYKLVTESEPFDRVEYEKAKFVRDREKVRFAGFDTHRTVTLRIPKGYTITQAISDAYSFLEYSTDEKLQSYIDELQPLDEVQPNEREDK